MFNQILQFTRGLLEKKCLLDSKKFMIESLMRKELMLGSYLQLRVKMPWLASYFNKNKNCWEITMIKDRCGSDQGCQPGVGP